MRRAIGIGILSTVALVLAAQVAGLRINVTASAPSGLWLESPIDRTTLRRGLMVTICPPEKPVVRLMAEGGHLSPGNCPNTQVIPLGKSIKALPGDLVRIKTGMNATVNGLPVHNTIAKQSVPAWPDGEYLVQPYEVWIFSSYSTESFDSRYFGPVPQENLRGKVIPLLVAGNVEEM